jgi:hypothetical protein
MFNPLNDQLNPICHLLVLLGVHHILHVSRIRVNPKLRDHKNSKYFPSSMFTQHKAVVIPADRITNISAPQNTGTFLGREATIGFPRRTVLHSLIQGVS